MSSTEPAATRPTVVLCRCPPSFWGVYEIIAGEALPIIENTIYAGAYAQAKALVFPHALIGAAPDFIETNSTIAEVEADPIRMPRDGAIYMPEGGRIELCFWVSFTPGFGTGGQRFHVNDLPRILMAEDLHPLENRPLAGEVQIRRDWRAVDIVVGLHERQEQEFTPNPALTVLLELKEEEKARSLRQFGLHSPYFKELAGHLNPQEWDALWQGWQAEDMARMKGEAA